MTIDSELKQALRRSQAAVEAGRVPAFGDLFAAAERRALRQRRWRRGAGGLVAVVVVTVVILHGGQPADPDWQFVDPGQLASRTSWVAPSDVLLPEHRFDIYGQIPVLIESTETDGGTLL